MRALVSERPGHVALRDVPVPEPGPGELLVRVEAALTCGTDLKLMRRGHPKVPFPVILGHEFSGVVAGVGVGAPFAAGDRVVCAVTGPCGSCPACSSGRENLCPTAFDSPLWGAFAEFVRVPERIASRGTFQVPSGLSAAGAALLDPLAAVLRGLSRLPRPPGATVLVLGSGPIALLFTALLGRENGTRVLVAGRRPGRLPAHAALGAETVDAGSVDLGAALSRFTAERGPDCIVDTTGDAAVVSRCLSFVARGGSVLLFAGLPPEARVEVLAARIHYDEVSLVGSFHYTPDGARRALSLLAAGGIPLNALVTEERPLADFREVFETLARGEGMKTAFVP